MARGDSYTQDRRIGRLHTSLGKDKLLLLRMTCVERLSEPFTIVVDAVSQKPEPIHTLLGANISIEFDSPQASYVNRWFNGDLWEYSELESDVQGCHYRLTLRPTMAFMGLNRNNRIFQKQSVRETVQSLLLGNKEFKLNGSYSTIEYCVQYRESDLDFASRLLEYEGIYYFFEHDDGQHKMVLVDDRNAHPYAPTKTVMVLPRTDTQDHASLWSVTERRSVGPTRATVDDYDFTTPSTTLQKSKGAAHMVGMPTDRRERSEVGSGGDWTKNAEMYDFPSKYGAKTVADGTRYSDVRLDSHRHDMARSYAEGSVFSAAVGRTMIAQFIDGVSTEYLIVGSTHRYSSPAYGSSGDGDVEDYAVELELMPASDQFRPPLRTPRPRIAGPHTAVVVGPSGEEIYTDKYGRIKVQFHWDRLGANDENSSCFIRVAQTIAGKSWGGFMLPRIGQEVMIEFLDGDPDSPICTGAVYNANNMPPQTLPDDQTQFGLKTRSTKGGGGFNQYWFDDKKGSEVVWFRAEKDYKALVENGDETRDYTKGNRITTLSQGNDTLKLKSGNRDIKLDMGAQKTETMQGIELICGQSKITINQQGITLEGMTIKIDAKVMLQTHGTMVEQKADAMHIVKGGIVMIN